MSGQSPDLFVRPDAAFTAWRDTRNEFAALRDRITATLIAQYERPPSGKSPALYQGENHLVATVSSRMRIWF